MEDTVGMDYNMAEEEKRWQAESDARALAEAEVIRNDPDRLKAAQKAAKDMADEQKKDAEAMSKIAGMKYKDSAP